MGSSPGINNRGRQVNLTTLKVIDNFTPDEQQQVDESIIADEQVLLALRSYLVRKHRLPWREKIKRYQDAAQWSRSYISVQQQPQCTPSITTSSYSDSPIGYFWHDPTELKYLDNPSTKNESFIVTDNRKEEGLRVHYSSNPQQDHCEYITSGAIVGDRIDASLFTSFAAHPDDTYVRRSTIAQKTWSNEEFRKKWWARRWGARTSRSQKLGRGRHLSDKLSQIPSEILRSAEFQRALLELGDEELTNITKSYLSSNQKRSDAAHRRKIELDLSRSIRSNNTDNITNNSYGYALLIGRKQFEDKTSEEGQREAQRKRSEKARLSYQTRLVKRQQPQEKQLCIPNDRRRTTSSHFNATMLQYDTYSSDLFNEVIATSSLKEKLFAPTYGQMPWLNSGDIEKSELLYQQAFIHSKKFTASLSANFQNISASDLILLLKPKRLAGRKQLLLRILKERFNLIGKCVPVEGGKTAFATHSSIKQLGDYVLHLLMKEQK